MTCILYNGHKMVVVGVVVHYITLLRQHPEMRVKQTCVVYVVYITGCCSADIMLVPSVATKKFILTKVLCKHIQWKSCLNKWSK